MRLFCRPLLGKASGQQPPRPVAVAPRPFSPSAGAAPELSRREKLVARLSEEVFSKGNVHLKNVCALSALPEGLHSFPEVCFIGKPNVGKSSIISSLLHNRRLGRSGGARGTTRLLQFFNVGDAMLLVDTPGYGGWGGRRLPQGLAERAGAFAALFRYLALRSSGPLKRVYWVMESTGSFQPRDEEILAFLQNERIPFSVLLSKIDRFKGDPAALQRQTDRIWSFLGSDEVPVLGVRASPKYPERCLNIEALQHDITYYCTQELRRAEDLTYKGVRELSYAPPSPEVIAAVEQRYPVEAFLLPEDDNLSLERLVLAHEEAKAKWLTTSPKAALLSAKVMAANHLVACCEQNCDDGDNSSARHRALLPSPALAGAGGAAVQRTLDSAMPLGGGASSFVGRGEGPRRFRVRASLRMIPQQQHATDCRMDADASTPDAYAADVSKSADPASAPPPSCGRTPLRSSPTPLLPQLPASLDSEAHALRAINGVPIAKSMITTSVARLPASQEGSLEQFSQHSSAGDYNRLLLAELGGQHTFIEEGEHAGLFESDTLSLRRPVRKSARRRHLDRVLEKYVSRVRKRRSLYVQAEGYMCPWLAGAGQPSRTAVVGSARDDFSRGGGGGGGLMLGLKRTGFGGKSLSAHTMKNRGRATKKTGFWAT
ncbi:GTP-binding protein [Trypanosoma conorhini]|uniref:GTP-binding protein n=1 Tax=Trypanosoma conorhini TaxID=83891 RepID=A0A3R7N974_9TRYP|nr:GTP-binding protein [Trypanosoma conorhini]RNF02534.1 GTP-binding protein [Trypanosoma conorhini]